MASLIDTHVLVYRFDPRFPQKQRIAEETLRRCIAENSGRLPHQAVVEFFAVVSRPIGVGPSLLGPEEAFRETEELLSQFPVLYPNDSVVRTALRGAAAYRLSWYDAHLWAYAEVYGLTEILSEDFQHDRLYGTVRRGIPSSRSAVHRPSQSRWFRRRGRVKAVRFGRCYTDPVEDRTCGT